MTTHSKSSTTRPEQDVARRHVRHLLRAECCSMRSLELRSGVARTNIRLWLLRRQGMTERNLRRLAAVLDLSLAQFLGEAPRP